ncbi:FAD pyrophosphatase [hydrothermal vent metagenome]|uniref:FAD pyrophosphatase n=1 Tax=hydrothermal vent metagenome TaxID=652676 RepID=A0A3B0Y175_9ZZZZ
MNFCSHCGSAVEHKIPEGDNRPRYVCTACDLIHYQNPRIIAGCIAEYENQVLLCTRAIEPRHGLWTLPAGFMENHETTLQAASRETYEEANAKLTDISLFCTYSIPHISQVYMMYRGQLIDGFSAPGEESLSTELFTEDQVPWDKIAFPVVTESLKLYFTDRNNGKFHVHGGEMSRDKDQQLTVLNYPVIS